MTPIQAWESEFGIRIDAEAFNAICEAADGHAGAPATPDEFVRAFRAMADLRDFSFRGPTAVEVADALREVRKKSAAGPLTHSSRCRYCQGSGVADWLWPWSRPIVGNAGAVVSAHYCPPQPCLCALGEFKRSAQFPEALAATINREAVTRILNAADDAGCGTALARMQRAEAVTYAGEA